MSEAHTAQDARALQTECTACPPCVVRCVHWEGKILALADAEAAMADHSEFFIPRSHYQIGIGEGWQPCALQPCSGLTMRGYKGGGSDFADLPAAEAEFERRERELLGRSEP